MDILNEIIDAGESLKSHTLGNLLERFAKNVDTENMPSWDIVWKGYHYANDIKNLQYREAGLLGDRVSKLVYYVSGGKIILNNLKEN
jgi:hypothetical protein